MCSRLVHLAETLILTIDNMLLDLFRSSCCAFLAQDRTVEL
jgi:hypothetical protein